MPAAEASWLVSLQGLARDLAGLVSDRVELLALELRRAGQALVRIVALVVAAAVLALTAWLALWGCAVGLLIATGLSWAAALLAVLLLNLLVCAGVLLRVRRLLPLLQLPATQRHLTLKPAAEPPPPHESRPDLAARAAVPH